jgi:hypothetical protein
MPKKYRRVRICRIDCNMKSANTLKFMLPNLPGICCLAISPIRREYLQGILTACYKNLGNDATLVIGNATRSGPDQFPFCWPTLATRASALEAERPGLRCPGAR